MSNKVVCINPKCRAVLRRPEAPFIKCPNCYTDFFVFCHEFPYKVFEHARCSKCPKEMYYFFCFKCNELMSYEKYRMGSVSTCKCGFSGCYVVCNHCHKPECFPPTQRYEGTAWKCEFCAKPFNFMTCDRCYYEVYRDNFYAGQSVTCDNMNCRANLTVKKCLGCGFIFIDSQLHNHCDPCSEAVQKSQLQHRELPAVNPIRNIQAGYTQSMTGPVMPFGTMQHPTQQMAPNPLYGSIINPTMLPRSNSLSPQMVPGGSFNGSITGSFTNIPPPPNFTRHNTYTPGQKSNNVYEKAK